MCDVEDDGKEIFKYSVEMWEQDWNNGEMGIVGKWVCRDWLTTWLRVLAQIDLGTVAG